MVCHPDDLLYLTPVVLESVYVALYRIALRMHQKDTDRQSLIAGRSQRRFRNPENPNDRRPLKLSRSLYQRHFFSEKNLLVPRTALYILPVRACTRITLATTFDHLFITHVAPRDSSHGFNFFFQFLVIQNCVRLLTVTIDPKVRTLILSDQEQRFRA